jgi:hypothetical protein
MRLNARSHATMSSQSKVVKSRYSGLQKMNTRAMKTCNQAHAPHCESVESKPCTVRGRNIQRCLQQPSRAGRQGLRDICLETLYIAYNGPTVRVHSAYRNLSDALLHHASSTVNGNMYSVILQKFGRWLATRRVSLSFRSSRQQPA